MAGSTAFRFDMAAGGDRREVGRDEVSYRTRATAPGGFTALLHIVNVSAAGFMARCEHELTPGEKMSVRLPGVGTIAAEVKWALGGRIGCQFDQPIALAPYLELLAEMIKQSR